ncbi:UNVERIFIED_CONTAM: hypothetical protein Sangu_3221400 [Sesamum angustifolium]|uniref:DUF4283 domain-containing protein n=1 Tax=Sesamum angustifolium TaxID=2727405 RepID=A0AAW2JHS3_9LAMI
MVQPTLASPLNSSPPPTMAAMNGQIVSSAGSSGPIIQPPLILPPRTAEHHRSVFAPLTASLPVVLTSPSPAGRCSTPAHFPSEFAAPAASPAGGDGLPGDTPPPVVTAAPLYIGNVPLTPCLNSVSLGDKITEAYHKSSRKTLSFVPPSVQNGEVIVRPSIDIIRHGSSRWKMTAVGYFLGKRPYFHHLNDYVRSIWLGVREVTATVTGFYFFQFKTEAAMDEVFEGGPWLFQGQPIVLQKWELGMALRKLKHTQVPVWIKLRHLPVELWTLDGLSTVASGIGKPLYPDAITRACTRLDFARVCVMLDISSKLPRHVIIMVPLENGGESACKVHVEYEWLPPKCNTCHSLGHATLACGSNKPTKPAVSVYVQKPRLIQLHQ